jgi:predicted NBD/HSP70 family sugar kinase
MMGRGHSIFVNCIIHLVSSRNTTNDFYQYAISDDAGDIWAEFHMPVPRVVRYSGIGVFAKKEDKSVQIGIDLGGTKIEVVAIDGGGQVLHRVRVPTPAGDYRATLDTLVNLVAAVEGQHGPAHGVGIGTPGSVSRATGTIKNSNSVCLNGRPLLQDLQARLGRPVHLANDANCFALSEAIDGAGAGSAIVFGVILGTGVGGGLVIDGRVIDGPNGITGEWGHNALPIGNGQGRDAPLPCYCGRQGCVETVLSGPALEADHAAANGGAPLPAAQIALRAAAGDAACALTVDRYARHLAQALAVVINIVDPDVVVLGGGVSNIDALYTLVPRYWSGGIFADTVLTRLVRNRHGDASGVRGAAWLPGGPPQAG